MNTTFVDTSFFLALALEDDALHSHAIAWHHAITGKLLTTEFVLLEVADDLSMPHLREFASSIFSIVKHDSQFTVIPISKEHFDRGLALYGDRPDKEWGLTDCISFEIMKDLAITDALTHDHHFEQAGFQALLRTNPPNN